MCGIVGFTHKDGLPRPERITTATATLVHRGPDQQGVYESSTCSLGATRLKILDLQSGDQPFHSDDDDTVIVFNGEIYNHLEIRAELEKSGHRFHTHCDTETVLHAFLEWDTACFEKLRGMFAIAIWTNSARRLVLARDRVGIKPLYIARDREEIFFGSELKAILIHPEIERRLSLPALDCYLALNYIPAPWTMIEGIFKVMPGTWVEWQNGKVRSDTYWSLPEPHASSLSLDSACEELDGLLQAVGPRAPDFRCAAERLAEWRPGFLDHPALRLASFLGEGQDVLDFVPRAQLRRKQLYPEDGRGVRHRT